MRNDVAMDVEIMRLARLFWVVVHLEDAWSWIQAGKGKMSQGCYILSLLVAVI